MIAAMSPPAPPDEAALAQVVAAIDPALQLTATWPLAGGVSSQVTAIEAELPGSTAQKLVVRQYGPANLLSDPQSAAHEYLLLTLLQSAGLAVPSPRLADESREILPVPYLVTEFIEGAVCTEPAQLTSPVSDAVRAALASIWPPPEVNRPVLLHGDYWPGNVLWRHGAITGVIDWEDAAFGDPLADLCLTRMELCMAFGNASMHELTRAYRDHVPGLDMTALPHWDLYAALRHAGRMSSWGLAAADLARLRAGHRAFVAIALAQVA